MEQQQKIEGMGEEMFPMMAFGQNTSFVAKDEKMKRQIQSTIDRFNDVKDLLSIADSFTTLPNGSMKDILKDSLLEAGNNIAETFFKKHSKPAIFGGKNHTAVRDELATAMVTRDLAAVSAHKFNQCFDNAASTKMIHGVVASDMGRQMGYSLLTEHLCKKHGFKKYLHDIIGSRHKLEEILSDHVYIVGTVVKQLTTMQILPVKMKLFFLKAFGSTKIGEIRDAWIKASSESLMKPVEDFVDKDNLLHLVGSWFTSNPFSSEVISACQKFKVHKLSLGAEIGLGLSGMGASPNQISYGDAVVNWMHSKDGPNKYYPQYKLTTGKKPDNVKPYKHHKHSGCFVGTCQVLYSDGTSKAIKNLQEKDKIFGDNGVVGTVSSEKVVSELDHDIHIFGFNDMEPFFTSGHPFMTQDGWRALDPELAKNENHWLEVGQLAEGDYVKRFSHINGSNVVYEWVKVKTITSKALSAGGKVYGVHLREGPRSYHANGFVVCLNYPEITQQNAAEKMKDLSLKEKLELEKQMDAIHPLLEKVLGSGPAKAMKGLTKKYLTDKISKKAHKEKSVIKLKDKYLPHMKLNYKAGKTSHGNYTMPTKLSLFRGKLFLDDKHIPEATLSKDNKVSWTRKVSDGRHEHGSVKLLGSGHVGHGYVALTKTRADTESEVSASVTATAYTNNYKCYKSKEAETANETTPDDTTTWEEFGELEMGTDGLHTVGKIMIPPMDELDDFGNHVTFSMNSKQQLTVNVYVPTDYWSILGYTQLTGVFNWDYSSFSGRCIQYDVSKTGGEGDTFSWRGTIEQDLTSESNATTAKDHGTTDPGNLVASSSHNLVKPEIFMNLSSSPEKSSVKPASTLVQPEVFMNLSSSSGSSSAKPAMLSTVESLTEEHLSLEELYLITPPDTETLHEQTFDIIQECTKYDMDSDIRKHVFGMVKPDLGGEEKNIADQYEEFFRKKFANAYTMNALSSSTQFEDKITEEQRNKLLYYWNGTGQDSLAHNADYNNAYDQAANVAFGNLCPTVQKYKKSSEGGEYWAEKLYSKLNEPQVLNGLALMTDVSQTQELINKQMMVLHYLAPDADYNQGFYKAILNTRLSISSTYFTGGDGDDEVFAEIMKEASKQLLKQVYQGGDQLTSEVLEKLQEQYAEACKEYNIDMTKTNEETAEELLGHMEDSITEVINIFNTKKGMGWDKLVDSLEDWREANPRKANAGNYLATTLGFAFYTVGIYFTVTTFMDWKELKPEQKVALVVDTVDLTIYTVSKVPTMIDIVKKLGQKGKESWKNRFKFNKAKAEMQNEEEIDLTITKVMKKNIIEIEEVTAEEVNEVIASVASVADTAAVTTKWARFFGMTELSSKYTGILGALVGCVLIGIQIRKDFKHNAPVALKVLDICQEVAASVCLVASGLGIFFASAIIPVIGIVCAVVGLVLALVSLAFKKDPPKPKPTAIEVYVKGDGGRFVDGLPAPTQEWLDNYHATTAVSSGTN